MMGSFVWGPQFAAVLFLVGIWLAVTFLLSYISGWAKALKSDNRLVIRAASAAQRAADYIRGKIRREDPGNDPESVNPTSTTPETQPAPQPEPPFILAGQFQVG